MASAADLLGCINASQVAGGIEDMAGAMFYVNSQDAVNNGSGGLASIASRVNTAHVFTGVGMTLDTTTVPGKTVLNVTGFQRAEYASATTMLSPLMGTRKPCSGVVYFYPTGSWGSGAITFGCRDSSASSFIRLENQIGVNSGFRIRHGSQQSSAFTYTKTTAVWQSWAWSSDGTNVLFYANGVLVGTSTIASSTVSGHSVAFLGGGGFSSLAGKYRAWAMFSRAITAAEVAYVHTKMANTLT